MPFLHLGISAHAQPDTAHAHSVLLFNRQRSLQPLPEILGKLASVISSVFCFSQPVNSVSARHNVLAWSSSQITCHVPRMPVQQCIALCRYLSSKASAGHGPWGSSKLQPLLARIWGHFLSE